MLHVSIFRGRLILNQTVMADNVPILNTLPLCSPETFFGGCVKAAEGSEFLVFGAMRKSNHESGSDQNNLAKHVALEAGGHRLCVKQQMQKNAQCTADCAASHLFTMINFVLVTNLLR